MKHWLMILFCVIVISGCASTEGKDAFDEILGRRLAELGWTSEEIECQVKSEREHYLYRNMTAEDFKRETAENYKNPEKYRLGCIDRQKEFELTRMNREFREKAREDHQNRLSLSHLTIQILR